MGMNKQNVFLLVFMSIILSGCSLIPKKSSPIEISKKEEVKQAEKLAKIMERGGSASCTVTEVANKENITAMKISGKKMRVEGQGFGESQKKGFMINDGIYSYIWSEGENQGYKTKLPSEQELNDPKEETENIKTEQSEVKVDQYDDETRFKVECQEGKIADSEFLPPSTVKFIDPSEMMKGLPGLPAGALDQLPK